MEANSLISIIDIAALATAGFCRGNTLLERASTLAPDGSELQRLCRQVIDENNEAIEAIVFERDCARRELVVK